MQMELSPFGDLEEEITCQSLDSGQVTAVIQDGAGPAVAGWARQRRRGCACGSGRMVRRRGGGAPPPARTRARENAASYARATAASCASDGRFCVKRALAARGRRRSATRWPAYKGVGRIRGLGVYEGWVADGGSCRWPDVLVGDGVRKDRARLAGARVSVVGGVGCWGIGERGMRRRCGRARAQSRRRDWRSRARTGCSILGSWRGCLSRSLREKRRERLGDARMMSSCTAASLCVRISHVKEGP